MRAVEFINEIERLDPRSYPGGKQSLGFADKPKEYHKLPGGAGFLYSVDHPGNTFVVKLYDTNKQVAAPTSKKPVKDPNEEYYDWYERMERWEQQQLKRQQQGLKPGQKTIPNVVGELTLTQTNQPVKNAVTVDGITVDEDYRGRGLAKALYGIVLSILKLPLTAGSSQTPGGARNWLSLVNIPGVDVKGFVQIDVDEIDNDDDELHDMIMQLGGQFISKDEYSEYWAFDVVPGTGELKPAIKNKLSELYDDYGVAQTGLIAYWHGQ